MKNLYDHLLKISIGVLLLLLYLYHFSFEQYEIIRFVLIASFAWLAIVEKEPSRKGWRFFFVVLVILFNPFYKLKIGLSNWKNIDLSVAVLMSINILSYYKFSKVLNALKAFIIQKKNQISPQKAYRIFLKLCLTALVIFVIWLLYNEHNKIQKEKESAKIKITKDSLTRIKRVNDSINEIKRNNERKVSDSIRNVKRFEVCNEKNALANFKSYMKFYYPTWRMKDDFKINSDGDCSYEISTLIKSTKYGGYGDFEALVVRISFWSQDYYQKYSISIIKSPSLFDN